MLKSTYRTYNLANVSSDAFVLEVMIKLIHEG